MRVENHKVTGIPFTPARHMGGTITPTLVVLHDTASRLDPGNAARYLADNDAGVSVHFVVERDGTITQQVPLNRQANHAGKSSYHGRKWCNGFSIGIEIVNPGKMTMGRQFSDGFEARAWWGQLFDSEEYDLAEIQTAEHGVGVWMGYTPAQIKAVLELLECLFRDVDTLTDVRTHWYVSPGRKVDTNPLFPLERMRALVLGRSDPADDDAVALSNAVSPRHAVEIVTGGSGLNMRRWPSFNPNVIGSIPNGAVVPVLRAGKFDGRHWNLVFFDGREGWIVDAYTKPV